MMTHQNATPPPSGGNTAPNTNSNAVVTSTDVALPPTAIRFRSLPAMLYPDAYVWLLFFSSLDIIMTRLIFLVGGSEANPAADYIIQTWGWNGAIAFKYALVTFAIIICEVVGRKRPKTGTRLSWTLVVIGAFPVFWSFMLLFSNPEAVETLVQ